MVLCFARFRLKLNLLRTTYEGEIRAIVTEKKNRRCLLFLYHALEHPDDGNASGEKLDLNYQPHRSTTSTSSTITSSGGGGSGKNERPIGKRYKLIVASNRDEVLDRPTAAMSFWEEGASNILAGEFFVYLCSLCLFLWLIYLWPQFECQYLLCVFAQ